MAIHQYPPGVGLMLGQFMAAAVLLSSTLKFEGKLVLQARSGEQIPLLMVECDHALNLRGIARGLLLQQLPCQLAEDATQHADEWAHACTLAGTLEAPELLDLSAELLLRRLFHQDPLRLFEPSEVRFRCNCSRERTLNALSALDPVEIEELLEELGSITMDCEFCNQQYRFTREDLAGLPGMAEPKTLH